MNNQQLLDSITTYREAFNSIEGNVKLTDEQLMHKYFSFEESKSTANQTIVSEDLIVRFRPLFEDLPKELKCYYRSTLNDIV